MTTTSFDDFSSEEWGPRSTKSRKGGSRTAILGVGTAMALTATVFAGGHFSMPFVQYIGSAAPKADVPAQAVAPAEAAPLNAADARGDRVLPVKQASAAVFHTAVSAKGDRVVSHAVSDEARVASAVPQAAAPSAQRFTARSTRAAEASASDVRDSVTAATMRKMAGLDVEPKAAPQALADLLAGSAREKASLADERTEQEEPAVPMIHPTSRPEVKLASLSPAETLDEAKPLAQELASIPMPTARPQAPQRDAQRELASIAAEGEAKAALAPAQNDAAVSARLPDAPLPGVRPARVAPAPAANVPAAASGQRAGAALAYAPPSGATDDAGGGLLGGLGRIFGGGGGSHAGLPGPGSGVAVYDIASATVYMPSGEKLEAHSGLGHMKDNPRFVDQKSKGPTPPNVYNLVMRENPFHGVQAVRLLPADGRKKFGRDGLLAHTYMYKGGGPISQSNGCVVFKDYNRFLAAFKRGKVNKMIVVPNMSKLPVYMAAL